MSETFAEEVYDTMTGSLIPEYAVDGVEDEYAEGKLCDQLYAKVYAANRRLCDRLGIPSEDSDVEIIISAMFDLQKHLCLKMYEYGAKFGRSE